jgi:hypothetical protein
MEAVVEDYSKVAWDWIDGFPTSFYDYSINQMNR